jgi:hypothetical protein
MSKQRKAVKHHQYSSTAPSDLNTLRKSINTQQRSCPVDIAKAVFLACQEALTPSSLVRSRLIISSPGPSDNQNICRLELVTVILALIDLGIAKKVIIGVSPNYAQRKVIVHLEMSVDDVQDTVKFKYLNIDAITYPIKFVSRDFVSLEVAGFEPAPPKVVENQLSTIFSGLGDLIAVNVSSYNNIVLTRAQILFRSYPPSLGNVSRIIMGSATLSLIWPRHIHPSPESALALDLTPQHIFPCLLPWILSNRGE